MNNKNNKEIKKIIVPKEIGIKKKKNISGLKKPKKSINKKIYEKKYFYYLFVYQLQYIIIIKCVFPMMLRDLVFCNLG